MSDPAPDSVPDPTLPPAGSHAAYSYLGPAGTYTEAALRQVRAAEGAPWRSVNNIGEALADVLQGRSVAAMMAIENTVEGGVAAVLDLLAGTPDLRIVGEYLVPVRFALLARPGVALADVHTVVAHPVAHAQCRRWLHAHAPSHTQLPATSNVQAAQFLAEHDGDLADAAIAPPDVHDRFGLAVLADDIGDNPNAVTRFVLIARAGSHVPPPITGADKTSIVVDLPSDRPGALLALLEQFATRGVNLSLLQSRPIGDELGRYRFVIDLDGHVGDERVAEALLGVRRSSPRVLFLGSYPRADQRRVAVAEPHVDTVYAEARAWLASITAP
ncbi:prephenate dehydratase [uncultured Amnibacterium sp.]|uniref:prephenate dehydratase n=1 Tax=uncultured Amnibacterium sp. TaxID=1631851 RepID=UPI0035CC2189